MCAERARSLSSGVPQRAQKLLVVPVASSLKRVIPAEPLVTRKRLRQLPT